MRSQSRAGDGGSPDFELLTRGGCRAHDKDHNEPASSSYLTVTSLTTRPGSAWPNVKLLCRNLRFWREADGRGARLAVQNVAFEKSIPHRTDDLIQIYRA